MKNLFISYSRHDSDCVSQLETRLEEFYEVFVDRSELTGGVDWENTIKEAIGSCDVFLAVSSGAAEASEWVARETLYAESLKKPRIPVLIEGALPFRLLNLQYVDFRGGFEAGFSDLLTALRPLAEPRLRDQFEADQLVGGAVRARLESEYARADHLLAQAQALDPAFLPEIGSLWEKIGQECSVSFDLGQFAIRENTRKVTPSRYKNHDTYQWSISLEGPAELMDLIDHVEYRLHPSFPKQTQIVRERESGFRLTELGWGIFPVTVLVHLTGADQPVAAVYHLTFQADRVVGVSDPGIGEPPI